MTANLYEKNNRYHVMLSWYQGKTRKQKSVATGIPTQGNNKRKSEDVRKRILKEWEQKIADNFQDILFSDYLSQWLETAKHSVAETTYFTYKATIEKQIKPYFSERKIKLHELKPFHIQSFYAWKMDEHHVGGNTIFHYHANIHKALKDAVRTELIKENPANKVLLPKKEQFIANFYTVEEMRLLLEAIQGEKIETPIYLACWFGLRRGEVCGLRWQDVDTDDMTLSVRGVITDKGKGTRTENLKYRNGAKSKSGLRSFPLPEDVADYLKRLKVQQANNRLLLDKSYNTKWADFICVDVTGELIKPEYLSRAFPVLLKKHGLRQIRFHELRDSNASLLLNNGVDMKLIQLWLGHAHYSTTADIYAHHRVDAKQILGDVLSKELVEK
jgi:integrase